MRSQLTTPSTEPPPVRDPRIVAVTATTRLDQGTLRVRLNAAYLRALEGAGLVPLIVPPLSDPRAAEGLLDGVAGLVLTGGEDVDPARYGATPHPVLGPVHRERDATELALVHAARERELPTLAICRGIQLLNVALGGTLVQDLPSERPDALPHDPGAARAARSHPVEVEASSALATALGATRIDANSIHHQAVDRVGAGLRVTARAPDGVIEGVETGADSPWSAVGVQWHPEELVDDPAPWDRGLFAAFAERCRNQLAFRRIPSRT
jgi:putative glutamine amidotransferase